MADLSDVENALVTTVLAATTPSADGSSQLAGNRVRVYRGTPPVTALTLDRCATITDITVFPLPETSRNTSRWGVQTTVLAISNGLDVSVVGQTATFAGSAIGGELAGLLVNGQPFIYQAKAGDSATTIASSLANQVQAVQICYVNQAGITIPGAVTLTARTAGQASVLREWSRQEQSFRLSVFAPAPLVRDVIARAIVSTLAQTNFLVFADGVSGRLQYVRTASNDDDQAASMYRRDLIYDVEYPTTTVSLVSTMLFGESKYNASTTYI